MQPTQVNRINPLNPLRALLSSLPNKMYHSAYYALSIAVVATALSSPPLLESRRAGGHRRTTAHNGFPLPLHGRRVISTFQPLRAHAHDASQRTVPMYDQAAVAALAKRHAFASDVSEAEDLELKAHIDRFLGLSPCGVNDAGNSVDEWLRPDSPRPLVGQSPEEVVATVLTSLKQLHAPGRPHHGAAVAMAFSVPIDALAAGRPQDSSDHWRSLLRRSMNPRLFAQFLDTSPLRPLLDWGLCSEPRLLTSGYSTASSNISSSAGGRSLKPIANSSSSDDTAAAAAVAAFPATLLGSETADLALELFSADGNLRSAFVFRLAQQGPLRPWLLFAVARLDDAGAPKTRPPTAAASTTDATTRVVATRRRTAAPPNHSVPPAEPATPSSEERASTAAAAEGQPTLPGGKSKGRTTRRGVKSEDSPSRSDGGGVASAAAALSSSARDVHDGEFEERIADATPDFSEESVSKTPQKKEQAQRTSLGSALSYGPEVFKDEPLASSVDERGRWTVVALKAALRERGLPVSGRKVDLLARLASAEVSNER